MTPLAPGYSPRHVAIDAEMVALGRPELTVRQALKPALLAAHQAEVEAWEYAHPSEAARWLELREEAKAEDARLYAERYGPASYPREQMRRAGFTDDVLLERAMRELRDTACFLAARDWLLNGTQWCLVLIGGPGCGKSQAAYWASHQMLTRRNFAPRCAQCRHESERPLYGGIAEVYRHNCITAPLLVLDDLGEGEQMSDKRSAWRAWADDVLAQRHAARRKTVITTNRTVEELGAWLSPGVADRLREGAVVSTSEQSMRGNAVQPEESKR